MIFQMAWRNTWRNPTRSGVVILAIAIGIWAAIFLTGFATGMSKNYVSSAIADIISHVQVHHPSWKEDQEVKWTIPEAGKKIRALRADPVVEAVSARTVVNGMISSPRAARGVQILGVDPEAENRVRSLAGMVDTGQYFTGEGRNELLLSRRMAEKLDANLRSKLVLTFQDDRLDITAGAFRVVGIFRTGNLGFDEGHVFVNRLDLNRLLGEEGQGASPGTSDLAGVKVHELAVLLKDREQLDSFMHRTKATMPGLVVESYQDIAPDLQLYESQIEFVSVIYLSIIMLALIFGIINTMLMAVLERMRELGMLMAIGMNKLRVFIMVVLETSLLALIGGPAGMALGLATIGWLGSRGLDLSAFSNALEMYGLSEVVYFEVEPSLYWQVPFAVMLTALLASLYPAFKAIRLRPVEAMRTI